MINLPVQKKKCNHGICFQTLWLSQLSPAGKSSTDGDSGFSSFLLQTSFRFSFFKDGLSSRAFACAASCRFRRDVRTLLFFFYFFGELLLSSILWTAWTRWWRITSAWPRLCSSTMTSLCRPTGCWRLIVYIQVHLNKLECREKVHFFL